MFDEEIYLREAGEELKKFTSYSSAIKYIKDLPIRVKSKIEIYSENLDTLKKLRNDDTTLLKEPIKAVLSSPKEFEKSLASLFKRLSNSVQKNLGQETASYFYYSDWLLKWTIIAYFPTIFCFVCIPHLILWTNNYSLDKAIDNEVQIIQNSYCLRSFGYFDRFNFTSFVQESEFLNIFMYGCFPGNSNTNFGYKLNYGLENAYLLSLIVFFLLWIFVIGNAMVKSISNSVIRKIRIQNLNILSSSIFCSWPYYSNEKKLIQKKKIQIENNLRLFSTCDNKKINVKRVVCINILFVTLLAGFITGMFYLVTIDYFNNIEEFVSQRRVVLAAFMTIFNYLTSFICTFLSKHEDSPKWFETRLNLIRIYVMHIGVFGVIAAYTILNRSECWEDEIGKLIFIFILFDFILSILDIFISAIYICIGRVNLVFNNSYYTINTLFSNMILWIGLYFIPYLGIMCIILNIIIFVMRVKVVKKLYKPSTKSGNTLFTELYIILITSFSIFLSILIFGGLILGLNSSKTCGPFNEEKFSKPYDYLIAFQNYLYELNYLGLMFRLVLSPGMISFIIFVLGVITYSMIKIMKTYEKTVKHLKNDVNNRKNSIKEITKSNQPRPKYKIKKRSQKENKPIKEEIEMTSIHVELELNSSKEEIESF